MKQTILGLRTTIYKVTDLAAAKIWYQDAFKIAPYFDEPFYVGFNIAGYELGLMPDEMEASAKTSNVLNYWGVDNLQSELDHFIGQGAKINAEPTNVGGDIMVASIIDPWGNVIGLIYNPDFNLTE